MGVYLRFRLDIWYIKYIDIFYKILFKGCFSFGRVI